MIGGHLTTSGTQTCCVYAILQEYYDVDQQQCDITQWHSQDFVLWGLEFSSKKLTNFLAILFHTQLNFCIFIKHTQNTVFCRKKFLAGFWGAWTWMYICYKNTTFYVKILTTFGAQAPLATPLI